MLIVALLVLLPGSIGVPSEASGAEKPPAAEAKTEGKDNWDKVAAVSGVLSALLVAVIGGAATYLYNSRQRARELGAMEVQTVASFLPHLQSDSPQEKEAALVAMSALGNTKLVTKLAAIYQDEASVGALSQIASGADPDARTLAEESLEQILTRAVVKIEFGGEVTSTGFAISPETIVTFDYDSRGELGEDISITTPEDRTFEATLIGREPADGVMALRAEGATLGTLQLLEPGVSPESLSDLAILGWGGKKGWRYGLGKLEGQTQPSADHPASLRAKLETEPGNAGAPVVDKTGHVVAVLYGSQISADKVKEALLIPVETIRTGLAKIGVEVDE
jgi:hypothetical protein